jgi:hypothetical protein
MNEFSKSDFPEPNKDWITIESRPVGEPEPQMTCEVEMQNATCADNSPERKITLRDPAFFRESLYVSLIDRYFELAGLDRYILKDKDGIRDIAFKHVESQTCVLIFSHLDESVLEFDKETLGQHEIIIDCSELELTYSKCPECFYHSVLEGEIFQKAFKRGFFFFIDGKLFGRDYSGYQCEHCWKPIEEAVKGKLRPYLDKLPPGQDFSWELFLGEEESGT